MVMASLARYYSMVESPEVSITREGRANKVDVDRLTVRLSTQGHHGVGKGGILTAYYAPVGEPAKRVKLLPGRFEALINSPTLGENAIVIEGEADESNVQNTRVLFNGSDMSSTIHELCLEVDRAGNHVSAYIRYVKHNFLGVEFESVNLL